MQLILNLVYYKHQQGCGLMIEKLFEKSHLKCKPNHWFEKPTPIYYDQNEVEQTHANSYDKVTQSCLYLTEDIAIKQVAFFALAYFK